MTIEPRYRRWIGAALGCLGVFAVAGFAVAWLGVYNVAASRNHWGWFERLLAFGMRHSVEARTGGTDVPRLDSPDMIQLGAAHFHAGCAYCHGAPGAAVTPIARAMLPAPPDLSRLADKWDDRALFWIVKHGLKYTGMPAWPAQSRDDEVWAVVAFVRRLPDLDEASYRKLALGGLRLDTPGGRAIATSDPGSELLGACARCHGADENGPASTLTPILHGQSRAFLMQAMRAYAEGRRPSGIMEPVAHGMSADKMQQVVNYYAALPPPPRTQHPDPETVERGRRLATAGLTEARIPACTGCHGATALPEYPRLAGQSAPYMAAQLRAFRTLPPATPAGAIMGPIAARLTDQQIDDVAAYFAAGTP